MPRPAPVLPVLLSLLLAAPVGAAELAGVDVPDTRSFAGESLVLNGVGLRKKLVIKVYVGALYLEERSSDADAILSSDSAKAVVMHFLRDVDAKRLVEAFREGFESNAPQRTREAGAAVDRFLALVPDVEKGTELASVWVPGRGLVVLRNGVERGVVDDRALAEAVFASYIGPKPPSTAFRDGLLGR